MLELSLELAQGAFHLRAEARLVEGGAILGPSGAGKTSLLEALAGLRPARGRIVLDGEVLQDTARGLWLPPERRRLGYVPQEGALFPHLSVFDNLVFGRPLPRRERRRRDDELEGLVEALELAPLLERPPGHLSGGERRRVAVGRAILARPRWLLVDEPTAGLDPERSRRLLASLLAARARGGVPLLVVTHRRGEALALASEVVLLEGGRMLGAGRAETVLLEQERQAGEEGRWVNVLPARLARQDETGGTSRVEVQALGEVAIPFHEGLTEGAELRLAVDAEDLLLSTQEPHGLSARNAWPMTIHELLPAGRSVFARVGPFLVHLTPSAVDALALTPGSPVWLITKTHSWRIVAG